MYNYSKNGVTLNAEVMATVDRFNEVARTLATESVEHTTAKKAKNEELEALINNDEAEKAEDVLAKIETLKKEIEALDDAWTLRQKALNFDLYGGKDEDGKKVDGICSIVTDDLYKAYVEFITNGTSGKYREALRDFCRGIINGDNLKDGAYNHMFNDIVQTMSSVRYNSNSQLAQGAAFITTVNKRNYKRTLLGAICDIVANNKTLKVKKAKTEK